MTDRTQFEQMLEALINEDQQKAKDIFHNIVVAKSREIYEELLESDFSESTPDGQTQPADDMSMGEEESEDNFSKKDSTDDQIDDVEMDDEEGEEAPEGDVEDRVQDLEDALEDLKAEFEQLMADEEGEPEHNDGMDDPEFGDEEETDDEFGMEPAADEFGMDDPEMAEAPTGMQSGQTIEVRHSFAEDDEQLIREYVEKVALPKHGDNGVNTKSPLAGKNDMGGTTANIAKGGESKGEGTTGGLASNKPQDMKTGNVNVPGGNAGKTGFKKKEAGHGAEKKGSSEQADKSASSTLNGVSTRAK